MDQIKAMNVNAADANDELLKVELQIQRKENALPSLDEWELVLASGGEGIPCW